MTHTLFIGDYAYSSWSLRGWLLFRRFGIDAKVHMVPFGTEESVAEQMARLAPPARTVPTATLDDGTILWESLAIAEELASRYPDAGIWPSDPKARGMARDLVAEMHAGFGTLRSQCPMNVRKSYINVPIDEDLRSDLMRLDEILGCALESFGGPWLCGEYSAADAFYSPVVARIAGFSLPVSDRLQAYVDHHLADGAFRRWRAMGLVSGDTLPWYAQDYETRDWPGPTPLAAKAVEAGPSVNETCPYSGDPVTDYLEMDGKVWGFCNPFCRDKTMVDPEAWPAFMEMVAKHG